MNQKTNRLVQSNNKKTKIKQKKSVKTQVRVNKGILQELRQFADLHEELEDLSQQQLVANAIKYYIKYRNQKNDLNSGENIINFKTKKMKQAHEEQYYETYTRFKFYNSLLFHDMNNIFHAILSATELGVVYLNKISDNKKLIEITDLIKRQVGRAERLVSNVNKLFHIEMETLPIQSREVYKVLTEAIEFVKHSFIQKKIDIQIVPKKKSVLIQANTFLFDIFENILNNAIKYNQNPNVEILIKNSEETIGDIKYLKMEFIDNGIGVPDAQKKLIFQKEYRVDRKVRGMGLGLSLVKKMLTIFNGRIWIEDKVPGEYLKGSKFIISIPKAL